MKTQISRIRKNTQKNYSSISHQQGRMLTDSDLTEQALLSRDRLNQVLYDVIGSGTPRHNALLQLNDESGEPVPELHWGNNGGRVYVDGIAADVRPSDSATETDSFQYEHQLYYPMGDNASLLPIETPYRLYLDVWGRSITWLEDEDLRDPGLHGADTTTRTQTLAQVKWCRADIDPLCVELNPAIGNCRLKLILRSLSSSSDLCDPCANELELNDAVGNYLFRVEVHDVHYDENDQADALVLKWSSENGAEAYKTADVPPDFSNNQYVYEFFDDISEKHLGVHLARDTDNKRFIDGKRADLQENFSATSSASKVFVRRWDGWCKIEKITTDNWQVTAGIEGNIDLTSGVGTGIPGHVTKPINKGVDIFV
ncbi:DUF6519 domain-containing protein [sulfur-oxidizing endosymbiont of Gigantopelta aegis]|uniref:DUF6519 domain-containing protein n=1 Tax=sulfur-oxidizing endosymbiont of Gigantopelta aegis TaxID=2794934 RepID=UPI001FE977C9|nr:DUF6519 domain-containing protein [sulfur-oxidizing endosymbiont of Gigantopelta aegis]